MKGICAVVLVAVMTAAQEPGQKWVIGNANDILFNGGGSSSLSFSLDAATDEYDFAFIPKQAFTVAKFAFRIQTETGTSPVYTVRLETDNGSGRPSGTLVATDTSATGQWTATGWTSEVTFTATAALSMGTIYHVRIHSASADASNFIAVNANGGVTQRACHCWYSTSTDTGSTWTTGTASVSPIFMLVSSDGTPKYFGQPIENTGLSTITNTAWFGAKFTAPMAGTPLGASIAKLNSTSTGTVKCYLIDGSNVIQSIGTVPPGVFDAMTGRESFQCWFTTAYTLTAGATYRVVWQDSAGALQIEAARAINASYKAYMPGRGEFIRTNGTASGSTNVGDSPITAWTDNDEYEVGGFSVFGTSVTCSGGGGGTRACTFVN